MACGVIKFLLPPTAINTAVYCHFFNKREKSLVVAGLNFVQVYRLNIVLNHGYHDAAPSHEMDVSDLAATTEQLNIESLPPDDDDDLYGPSQSQPTAQLGQPKQVILEIQILI
jgi:hypothetical protein